MSLAIVQHHIPHARDKVAYIRNLLSLKEFKKALITARAWCHEGKSTYQTTRAEISGIKSIIEDSVKTDPLSWRDGGVPLREQAESYITQFAKKTFRPLASLSLGIVALTITPITLGASTIFGSMSIIKNARDLKLIGDHFRWNAFERKYFSPERVEWGGYMLDLGADCGSNANSALQLAGVDLFSLLVG